ncbi:protein phosphatase 2C-like domain-containing protein 1 [Aplysia californica]|uniref:Protein phosphatase 2C-like domain-containing protein 1 n=1 Tax=Aplysia californica TaxID=6500 RepID=A0ABM0JQH1_APLCA|nr:protein phosphatase 2C-like domain-containing protein 1 [Aplysia californica]
MEEVIFDSKPNQNAGGSFSVSGVEDEHMATDLFKGRGLRRSDTPETLLTDFSNRPDITILCDKCSVYQDVRSLPYHRSYHDALELLGYMSPTKPADVDDLLQRRNGVLRRLKLESSSENPLRIQDITKIDDAYELLKSDMEDTYDEMKRIVEKTDVNVRGAALSCSPSCAYAVGMCSSENRRWKSYMEDVKVYQDYFGEDRNKCYLAVFDGYHGTSAAERSGNELHHLLLHEMAKFDSKTKSTAARNFAESAAARTDYELLRPETRDSFRVNLHQDSTELVQNIMDLCYEKYNEVMKDKLTENEAEKKTSKKKKHPMTDKMHQALKKTYLLMDILLSYGKDERSKVRWSGTSALTAVVQNIKKPSNGEGEKDNKLASLEEEVSGSEGQKHSARGGQPNSPEELGLIHVANAGNSHALLVRDNKPYHLTKDHTPNNPKERKRVLNAGGNLSNSERDTRLNGVLSVTRGLGNHGDKKLKDCVLVDPHVTTIPIDQYAQFLVLASHGVWEVFSPEEVASLLSKMLPSQFIPAPSRVNETLLPLLQSCQDKENSNKREKERTQSVKSFASCDKSSSKQEKGTNFSSRVMFSTGPEAAGSESGSKKNEQQDKERTDVSNVSGPNEKQTNTLNLETSGYGTTNVLADLHTEIGSHLSETTDDISLHRDLGEDYLSVPIHSQVEEGEPQTPEGFRRELAKNMAEHLTQAALLAGSRDNITVMVLLLPGCGV